MCACTYIDSYTRTRAKCVQCSLTSLCLSLSLSRCRLSFLSPLPPLAQCNRPGVYICTYVRLPRAHSYAHTATAGQRVVGCQTMSNGARSPRCTHIPIYTGGAPLRGRVTHTHIHTYIEGGTPASPSNRLQCHLSSLGGCPALASGTIQRRRSLFLFAPTSSTYIYIYTRATSFPLSPSRSHAIYICTTAES